MTDWKRIEDVFLEAVELTPAERPHRVRALCGDDLELLAEVQSLLEADADDGRTIETAVQDEAASLFDAPVMSGQRLGIYRVVKEIGHGGMGAVYLAHRDDEEFEKSVAIKVVKRGMDTAEVLARFRHERQILANLEHPYIARLLDGGTTADGLPFFVMEYIEGQPVDVYCRERGLTYKERCQLFLRILDAVAYAHRNLVVHRDLKPANILIAEDGTPKLLDFGVAGILGGSGAADVTRVMGARPYTPGYASPEQVLGLALTTATDIYSLGAILYELLTGRRAQNVRSHTPAEIEEVVCHTEPQRPSREASGLPSELDDIVLMAMRKEPPRRYGSAVEFAEDLRRFLDGRPVVARPDSALYRLRKFAVRNRIQVALAIMLVGSLAAGLIISLVQTERAERAQRLAETQRRIAEHEMTEAQAARQSEARQEAIAVSQRWFAEQQREVAEQQRAIAQQRVKDMVDLSGRTLFDVHDAIAELPGSVEARRTIVKTTLEYLENLRHQQGLNDDMRMALSGGYYKIALIQGNPEGASLQDFSAAERSLREGEQILMPAYRRHPNQLIYMLRYIEIRSTLANFMGHSRRENQAIAYDLELLPIARQLAPTKGCVQTCLSQEAFLEQELAKLLTAVDSQKAMDHAIHGVALMRGLVAKYPEDNEYAQDLGSMSAAVAAAYRSKGELATAAQFYQESIAVRERLLQLRPHSNLIRRNLMIAYGNYAVILGIPWSPNLNRPEEARLYAKKCVALAREIAKADPNDATARQDLGMSLGRLGMIDPAPGAESESLAVLQEAYPLLDVSVKANPKSAEPASRAALILEFIGRREESLGRKDEARASYDKALAGIMPFLDAPNPALMSEYLALTEGITRLQIEQGSKNEALALAQEALRRAQAFSGEMPNNDVRMASLFKAWAQLSLTQQALAMQQPASESARESLNVWNALQSKTAVAQYVGLMNQMKMIAGR